MIIDEPTPPDWERATTTVVPALSWGTECALLPDEVIGASSVVLLVIDSLGWQQLEQRRALTPRLNELAGGMATTVAPSTTAAALTSISTGVAPGEHGIVGYRFPAGGAVMNSLRWSTPDGDHRKTVTPGSVQPLPPLAGADWTVVSDRQFATSAFTEAYLGNVPYVGFMHPSSLVAEVAGLLAAGRPRIYAYYDGLDHVAHIHGVSGSHYQRELAFCDWLVGQLLDVLPRDTALVVTADHGQLDAPGIVPVAPEVLDFTAGRSGEARFRWLHARPGAEADLHHAARAAHGDMAWVMSRDELISGGWFGPSVSDAARSRLGDVALLARAPIGFDDPGEAHLDRLYGRHGSVTAAEMLVPVLWARG